MASGGEAETREGSVRRSKMKRSGHAKQSRAGQERQQQGGGESQEKRQEKEEEHTSITMFRAALGIEEKKTAGVDSSIRRE